VLLSKSIASAIEANIDHDDNVSNAALVGHAVSNSVVFCSMEPPSRAEQKQFEHWELEGGGSGYLFKYALLRAKNHHSCSHGSCTT
jgi:hypothetical protein